MSHGSNCQYSGGIKPSGIMFFPRPPSSDTCFAVSIASEQSNVLRRIVFPSSS
nr:MAG TPA: hypothetical protein [Caudoviricetes sp.]